MSVHPALLLAVALVALAATCQEPAPAPAPPAPDPPELVLAPDTVDVQGVSLARATIEPVGRGDVSGTVTFTRVAGGVRVQADLYDLSRQDFHAMQVLRGRDCEADPALHLGVDAGTPHGGPYSLAGRRHAGDLGNVRGDRGRGRYDRIDTVLSLDGTASAVGRALVLRALPDDAASPDGAAGDVIGCGIIERIG